MLTIHQRPFEPEDRSEAGHWEGDLIIGKDQGSAIGTMVERQTRSVRLLHLTGRDGESLHQALKLRMGDLPPGLVRSITWDQGTEMAPHVETAKSLGAPVYFCDSHSPWQRGSNENTNGPLHCSETIFRREPTSASTARTICSRSKGNSIHALGKCSGIAHRHCFLMRC